MLTLNHVWTFIALAFIVAVVGGFTYTIWHHKSRYDLKPLGITLWICAGGFAFTAFICALCLGAQ